jgi:hypothetical protein
MKVTDDHVAALRAQLRGDSDEHIRFLNRIEETETTEGYVIFVTAAFFEAVDRRFSQDTKATDETEIIEFIATIRASNPDVADDLDPSISEPILLHALGKGNLQGIEGGRLFATRILLLAALVGRAEFSETELDAFLAKARAEADARLS